MAVKLFATFMMLTVCAMVAVANPAGKPPTGPPPPESGLFPPPPGFRPVKEFFLNGPMLDRLKQARPNLQGVTSISVRRFEPERGEGVRDIARDVHDHYLKIVNRDGWFPILSNKGEGGRKRTAAFSSPDGDGFFAYSLDPRGITTSTIRGTISLDQIAEVESSLLDNLAPPGGLPSTHEQNAVARSVALEKNGKLAEAEKLLLDTLQQKPNSVIVRHRLAGLYERLGKASERLDMLKQMVGLVPSGYMQRLNYARGLVEAGNSEEALFELRQASALAPDKGTPYFHMAEVFEKQGKLEKALGAYSEAALRAPHWESVYLRRGGIFEKLGDKAKARLEYQQALSVNPGSKAAADGLQRVGG